MSTDTFYYQSTYSKMMGNTTRHRMRTEIDYTDLYLAFLNRNKNYLDNLGNDGAHLIMVTHEQVGSINRCPYWTDEKKKLYIQKWCFTQYIDDTERMEWLTFEANNIKAENITDDTTEGIPYFTTVTFQHDTDVKDQLQVIKNILNNKKVNQEKSFAVYERFRDDGKVHPHVHFKLVLRRYERPSKVVEFIFATKWLKKVCHAKNFIDVDKYIEARHDKYLDGDKKEAKVADVERDRQYRLSNNIPDQIRV